MTRLLVSVRNAEEALAALRGGADLIDVKEPSRGSLGAADPQQIAAVFAAVAGRVPISVALGELVSWHWGPQTTDFPLNQSCYAKLGLAAACGLASAAPHAWPQRWSEALATLPPHVQRVAVAYADWRTAQSPDPWQLLRHAAKLRCSAVLVDTFDKSAGSLLDLWPPASLAEFIDAAWTAHLLVVLGGSVNLASLPAVAALEPDYIAVRGAVCRGGREARLDGDLVRALSSALLSSQRQTS